VRSQPIYRDFAVLDINRPQNLVALVISTKVFKPNSCSDRMFEQNQNFKGLAAKRILHSDFAGIEQTVLPPEHESALRCPLDGTAQPTHLARRQK
jgi:hypothetical protein